MEQHRLRLLAATFSLAFSLSPLTSPTAHAATLAAYDFDAADGSFEAVAQILAAPLTASPWSDVDGTLTNFTGNPVRAIGARSFDDGNSLRLTLSASGGKQIVLDALRFDQLASASGPRNWVARVNDQIIGSGTTTTAFSSIELPLSALAGTLFEFSLEGSGATSGQGTWRVDNFLLTGSVASSAVPLPAAFPLLASTLLLLVGSGRRQPEPVAD